jgi:hypothetical protein
MNTLEIREKTMEGHRPKHDVSQPMGLSRVLNYTMQKDIFSVFVQAARARLRYFSAVPLSTVYFCEFNMRAMTTRTSDWDQD